MTYPPDYKVVGPTWTRSEIRESRRQVLKPILENLGYRLKPLKQNNYLVMELPDKIVIKDNYWVNQEDGTSGNAIDFFVKLCGKNFNDTMKLLQL